MFASLFLFWQRHAAQKLWLNSAVSITRHLRWEDQKGQQRMKTTHHVWPSMTPSISGATCSSNKAATASSVGERSHGQKLQHKQGKQSAKRSSKRQSKATASGQTHKEPLTWRHGKRKRCRSPERSDFKRAAGTVSCAQGGGGWTWKPRRETIKRLTIKAWVALKLITASVVCYQLGCDALMTSRRGKKTKKTKWQEQKPFPHSNMYQPSFRSPLAAMKKNVCSGHPLLSECRTRRLKRLLISSNQAAQQVPLATDAKLPRWEIYTSFFFSLSSRQATKTAFQKEKEKQRQKKQIYHP